MSIRVSVTFVAVVVVCLAIAAPAHAGFSGTDVFLPSVGSSPGVPPSYWYTTVWIHNPNATTATVTIATENRGDMTTSLLAPTVVGYAVRDLPVCSTS